MEDTTVPYNNEEVMKYCKTPDKITKDFVFQQTMYRIKDPKRSLEFYTGMLGMKLLQKMDFPEMKFSLYFMGYVKDIPDEPLGSKSRTEWALNQSPTVELTHNWNTENDPTFTGYHNGNAEPRGFGHIGIAVPDVEKVTIYLEQNGVEFVKKPSDGKMKGLAFIKDPDGYWIEIFNNKTV